MQRLALIIGPVLSLVLMAGAAAWIFWPFDGRDDQFSDLKDRGKLSVGVRTDAEPFSYLDPSGQILGFEPELARALADAIGVPVNLVPVDVSNATGFVERGVIDLALLPVPGLFEDGEGFHLVEPGYFASGLTAVTRPGSEVTSWASLSGLAACGRTASAGVEGVVGELGARFIGFSDTTTALQALAAERCDVLVEDETAVMEALADLGEAGFERPLGVTDVAPWRIIVSTADDELPDFVRGVLTKWHLDGYLIERAATWDLPRSPYLAEMQDYVREPAVN